MTTPLDRTLDDLRRRHVPDARLGVFEVGRDGSRLAGATSSLEALRALRALAAEAGLADAVVLLPDAGLGEERAAVVTAALAPLMATPAARAERLSEALHGETLVLLERRGAWLRARGGDGYHAWIHGGYVTTGTESWADDWSARSTARALGVELRLADGRLRLPVGARVALDHDGTVETADGRRGRPVAGAVRPETELGVEARLVACPEWAWHCFANAPYLWGGRTEWGVDCSGLVQATYGMRGTALPRDTDLQAAVGDPVPLAATGAGYQAGDLLFFADDGRISHVALWAGAGRIVHSALARGGVASDNLFGDGSTARRLRPALVAARRVETGRHG